MRVAPRAHRDLRLDEIGHGTLRFKDQDHSGITTVGGLQQAMFGADIDGYGYLIWDDQRDVRPPDGAYVVLPLEHGYRLTCEERGNVYEAGVYPDQAAVVREVLRRINPKRRQTPQEAARAAAASRESAPKTAAYRAELQRKAAGILARHNQRVAESAAMSRQTAGRPEATPPDDRPT